MGCEREPGVIVEQIAKDFGVHPMTMFEWLRQAGVDEGAEPAVSRNDSAELRDDRKWIKLLKQENEVMRQAAYLSQANLPGKVHPLVTELAAGGIAVAVTCRLLNIVRQPYYRWLAQTVTDVDLVEAYRADALVRRPPRRFKVRLPVPG